MREWLSDWVPVIFGIMIFAVVAGGIAWLVYADVNAYRTQCYSNGGHIISVKSEEICVDRDNQVIFL